MQLTLCAFNENNPCNNVRLSIIIDVVNSAAVWLEQPYLVESVLAGKYYSQRFVHWKDAIESLKATVQNNPQLLTHNAKKRN